MHAPPSIPPASERGPRVWWAGLPPERRRLLKLVLAVAILVVLVVSVLLARFLQVENIERDDDLALIQAETRGDEAAMLARITGCRSDPACVASVHANAANPRLHREGAVKILSLESETANSPTGDTGTTRLAWTVIGKLPIVQCVKVRRTGNFLTGEQVQLLALSAPISGEGVCHKRTQNEIEEEEATRVEQ